MKQYVRWYSYRWLIERYHYVLKSGCHLEKLQLKTAQRLEMALATYSIVAWRLLWLTYQARCHPDGSCEGVLQPHEWQALYATIHGEIYPHLSPPTLAEVVRWIAQLGSDEIRQNRRWLFAGEGCNVLGKEEKSPLINTYVLFSRY